MMKKWTKKNNVAILALLTGLKGQKSEAFGSIAEDMKKNANAYDEFKKDIMEIKDDEYKLDTTGEYREPVIDKMVDKWKKKKDSSTFVKILDVFVQTKQEKYLIPKADFTDVEKQLSSMAKDYLEFAKDLEVLKSELATKEAAEEAARKAAEAAKKAAEEAARKAAEAAKKAAEAAKKAKELALKKLYEGKIKKWNKKGYAELVALLTGLQGQKSKEFGSKAEAYEKDAKMFDEFKKDVMEIKEDEYKLDASGEYRDPVIDKKMEKWEKRKGGDVCVKIMKVFLATKQEKYLIPKADFTKTEQDLSSFSKDYLEFAKDLKEIQGALQPIEASLSQKDEEIED